MTAMTESSPNTLELSFVVDRTHWRDYIHAANAHASRGGIWAQFLSGALIGFLYLFVLVAGARILSRILGIPMHDFSFAAGMFTAWLLLSLTIVLSTRGRLARFIRDDGHVLGRRHIRLTHEGVETWGRTDQARYTWAAFEDVSIFRSLVVLWLEPSVALMVPRSVFTTPDAETEFVTFAAARVAGRKD
jgi:hypothetical protein